MNSFFVFVIIIVFISVFVNLKVSLELTLLFATFLVILLKKAPIFSFFQFFLNTFKDTSFIDIFFTIVLIEYLVQVLAKTENLKKFQDSFKSLFKNNRVSIPFMPFFIGALPMPGGALVSAPMVEEASSGLSTSRELKFLINYWFRHLWEPISPLYPGFLLQVGIFQISLVSLIKTEFPVALFMVIAGLLFIIPKIPQKDNVISDDNKTSNKKVVEILKSGWPIIFIFSVILIFKMHLIIAISITIIILAIIHKISLKKLFLYFKESVSIKTLFLIFVIFLFKNTISGVHLVEEVGVFFKTIALPDWLILFLIPLFIGFLTGLNSGFIGISFPLLASLIVKNGVFVSKNLLIAFLGGYTGVLLTPLHLCLSLTLKYFDADSRLVYRYLFPMVLMVVVLVFLLYFLK